MNDFTIMLHFDLLKLKNYVVEIKRSPKKAISYALFLGWLVLVIGSVFLNRGKNSPSLSPETLKIILGLYAVLVSTLLFWSFFSSLQKLSYSFNMGDVNLLFPSPIEPRRILFWSMMKKVPLTLAQNITPALFLTPTLLNMGISGIGLFYIYLSVASMSLLPAPLSFLIFLLSVRYKKQKWVRTLIIAALIWLLSNWLLQVGNPSSPLDVLNGYLAPGVWNFPFIGWIIQLAYAGLFGPGSSTYLSLAGIFITLVLVNTVVFRLARDFYEDVLDFTQMVSSIRQSKRQGTYKGPDVFRKRLPRKRASLNGNYPGGWAFMFKQVVRYKQIGLTTYLGYLTLVSAAIGVALGAIARAKGLDLTAVLLAANAALAYGLLLASLASPVGTELNLPFIYILPGTFFKKVLGIIAIPVIRFGINVTLLNASLVFTAGGNAEQWSSAILVTLILVSINFMLGNTMVLACALLPSSLDRKIFNPLLIFVQLFLVALPSALAAGIAGLTGQGIIGAQVAVALTNLCIGVVLLLLSDSIFRHVEMREFDEV